MKNLLVSLFVAGALALPVAYANDDMAQATPAPATGEAMGDMAKPAEPAKKSGKKHHHKKGKKSHAGKKKGHSHHHKHKKVEHEKADHETAAEHKIDEETELTNR